MEKSVKSNNNQKYFIIKKVSMLKPFSFLQIEICYIIEMGKKIEKKEPRPIFDRAQIVFLDLNSAIVFIRLIYPVVRFFILNCLFQ